PAPVPTIPQNVHRRHRASPDPRTVTSSLRLSPCIRRPLKVPGAGIGTDSRIVSHTRRPSWPSQSPGSRRRRPRAKMKRDRRQGAGTMDRQAEYRIMIVEDDAKIAAILADELCRYGFQVVRTATDADVKEAFLAHRPHLVLLDVNLPRYDGFYWCRQLRAVSKAPIIFISARADDLDQVRALEHGGDDYITKPFNLELVVAKVHSSLRRAYGEYAAGRDDRLLHVKDLVLDRTNNNVSCG